MPNISVIPVVIADLEEFEAIPGRGLSKKSFFECSFDDSPFYFDIIWYINGEELRRTKNVEYGDLSTTRLLPEHWVHQYNLNMVVS